MNRREIDLRIRPIPGGKLSVVGNQAGAAALADYTRTDLWEDGAGAYFHAVVGFRGRTMTYDNVHEIAQELRTKYPDLQIDVFLNS